MIDERVVGWLSEGDPSLVWQVERDLLGLPRARVERTRARVATSGWGARLLDARASDGTWGGGLYTPKWTSTFYTLKLLVDLGVRGDCAEASASCRLLLDRGVEASGGVRLWKSAPPDTCVTGMLLRMAIELGFASDPRVARMTTWLLEQAMPDGGWNCRFQRRAPGEGATHASFATTTSVLEALHAVLAASRRQDATLARAAARGRELMLEHRLYRSHRTGAVVRSEFTRLHFPVWWKFDVLRALDDLRAADAWDARLEDPIALVASRRGEDGRWPLARPHPGRVWFDLETPGAPSRWITLRASRVLAWAERARRARRR